MKKILMILCLTLALCMLCGLALAEDAPKAEPETREIPFVDAEGRGTGETFTVTKTEIKDADGNVIAIRWLDKDGKDWGDVTFVVKGEHDYVIWDKTNPLATPGVTVVYAPTEEYPGILRVHCKNPDHLKDDYDVKEYTIYYQQCVFPSEKEVNDAIAKNKFNASFKGFVKYVAPVCKTMKNGTATVKCICESEVHWVDGTGFVGHVENCKEQKKYTIKAAHIWSDEEKDILDPYKDLVHPTCSEPGQIVGYCLVCGIEKNKVLGDDVIVNVLPLFHHTLKDNKPAWEVRVKEAPNCKESGITGLWCTLCEDWISEADCAKLFADGETAVKYPIITPADGSHVRSRFIFDAWKIEAGQEKRPTCTREGTCYGHYICLICHMVFGTEEMRVDMLNHDYEGVDWTPVDPKAVATCTDGVAKQKVCKRCDGKEVGIDSNGLREVIYPDDPNDLYFNDKNHYDKATGQSALVLESIEKAATCTEDGLAKYFCTKCHQIVFEIIPKLNHTLANGKSAWVKKTYTGWCGGEKAVTPDKAMVGSSSYTYEQCSICNAIANIVETAKHEHNWTAWQLRNEYEAYEDGSTATPEYWEQYCTNHHPVNTSIKCAQHKEWITDYPLNALGLNPDTDPQNPANIPDVPEEPVPTNETFEMPEDVTAVKDGGRYKIKGNVDINDKAALPEYAFVRLTLFYFDGSAEVTFTSLNLKTGAFTYASSKPFAHVSAVVLDNNEEINDVPADQQYSDGKGWTYTMEDYE